MSRYSVAALLVRGALSRSEALNVFEPFKNEALDALVGLLNYERGAIEMASRRRGLEVLQEHDYLDEDRLNTFYDHIINMHKAALIAIEENYEILGENQKDSFSNTLAALIDPIYFVRQTGEDFYQFFCEYLD